MPSTTHTSLATLIEKTSTAKVKESPTTHNTTWITTSTVAAARTSSVNMLKTSTKVTVNAMTAVSTNTILLTPMLTSTLELKTQSKKPSVMSSAR